MRMTPHGLPCADPAVAPCGSLSGTAAAAGEDVLHG
jgi:hypothetical protein